MPTSTTNYGLIKPGTDDPILVGQLNDNMDTIDTVLKDHSDKIDAAALGIKYKGEVNYYADLPNNAKIGDAYTVKYAGSSGTTPDGTEYVWGAVSGTNQWINFSKDSYSKAEVDALLAAKQALLNANNKLDPAYINYNSTHRAVSDTEKSTWNGKQNALSSTQLDAVNSGIDSTKVAQIGTNKNNILSLAIANGKKQIIPYFGTISQGNIICTQSGNAITVSGTKGEALLNINICTISYSDAGIRAGDTLIITNDNTNVLIGLYFFDGTNYSNAVIARNETINVIVPSDYNHILIRLMCAATITTINETIHPMICQKLLYEASPAVVPYAMSNAELTAAIQALQAQLANQ